MRDNLFTTTYTDGFYNLAQGTVPVIPTPAPSPGPGPSPGPSPVPPPPPPPIVQDVQPKVLLAHFEADAAGAVVLDTSLGIPVVTKWIDKINNYELLAPAISQAPQWVIPSTMASLRPVLAFDGVDIWLDAALALRQKLVSLEGLSITMVVAASNPGSGNLQRLFYVDSGNPGQPRFGYAQSGLGADRFYHDGATLDTDPYPYVTGGTPTYDGWAVHTLRRNYLTGKVNHAWNGEPKIINADLSTPIYSSNSVPGIARVGAGYQGANPAIMHLYALKIYTYSITDTELDTDNIYGTGRINTP